MVRSFEVRVTQGSIVPNQPMTMARATVGPWEAKRQLAFVNRRHERGRFVAALRDE